MNENNSKHLSSDWLGLSNLYEAHDNKCVPDVREQVEKLKRKISNDVGIIQSKAFSAHGIAEQLHTTELFGGLFDLKFPATNSAVRTNLFDKVIHHVSLGFDTGINHEQTRTPFHTWERGCINESCLTKRFGCIFDINYPTTNPEVSTKPFCFTHDIIHRQTEISFHNNEGVCNEGFTQLGSPIVWENTSGEWLVEGLPFSYQTIHEAHVASLYLAIRRSEIKALAEQVKTLRVVRKALRIVKNTLDILIARITNFTKEGLYQVEPLIQSTFHYFVNKFTIEKFIGLLGFQPISNSIIFSKWQNPLYQK